MSETISIVAALYELQRRRGSDLTNAVKELISVLCSGDIVASALIDGILVDVAPQWWHFARLRPPHPEATLTIFDPPGAGPEAYEARTVHATQLEFNLAKWDRLLRELTGQPRAPAGNHLSKFPSHVPADDRSHDLAHDRDRSPISATAEIVSTFIRDYLAECARNGSEPTQLGLEKSWKKEGHRGKRDELRAVFNKVMGGKLAPGRPKKPVG